jgi:hypothetical protein
VLWRWREALALQDLNSGCVADVGEDMKKWSWKLVFELGPLMSTVLGTVQAHP